MKSLMGSLAVVAVLLVGGCSAGADSSEATGADAAPQAEGEAAQAPAQDGGGALDAGETGTGVEEAVGEPDEDRQFVVEGSVSLKVETPSDAAQDAARIVETAGGFVQERAEQAGEEDEPSTAYLVVRIPSEQVTPTVEALKELGEIHDSRLTSTEVTAQARDLDARIRALQLSIARLEQLLANATTIPEIQESEQILLDRQVELETLQAQASSLSNQVAMATFRIDFWSEGAPPPVPVEPEEPATGFIPGLLAGWTALMATLTGVLQVIGALLPWLVFAGLITFAVVALRRATKQRWPAKAPATAPAPPATAYAGDPRANQAAPVPGWPVGPPAPAQQPQPLQPVAQQPVAQQPPAQPPHYPSPSSATTAPKGRVRPRGEDQGGEG